MSEAVTTVQTYLRGIVEKAMNDGDSTVTCSIAFLLTIADKFERLAAEHYTLLCAQEQNEPLTLEQLSKMSKTDWVWVVFPELEREEDMWEKAKYMYNLFSHENYGKTWIAYAHEPKSPDGKE